MKKLIFCVLSVLLFSPALRAESTGEILTFPANPEKGFHWGYMLYLPQTMDTSKKLPILLTMNDSGVFNSLEQLTDKTLARLERNDHERQIADGVGVPMLIPLVLRERGAVNTHDFNRAVFTSQEPMLKKLDEQVLRMLQAAREELKKRGMRTDKKFLVAGFSSAGGFGWRWTMLHPEYVLAAALGGELVPMLPLETMENTNLIFPVGVYDFQTYSGKKFNKKVWLKVPILLTNGAQDYNDPLSYPDCFGDEDRAVSKQVLGAGNCQQRWQKAREFLAQYAPNVQTHTYPNMEHDTVWQDEIDFLKQHIDGGPLAPITPTDTSDRPSILPVKVSQLYWGQEAPLTTDREYLEDTALLLQTRKKIPYWIRYEKTCKLDIEQNSHRVLENIPCRGLFHEPENTYLEVPFSDEQVRQLRAYKDRTFSVRSHYPEILEIPAELTFTVR